MNETQKMARHGRAAFIKQLKTLHEMDTSELVPIELERRRKNMHKLVVLIYQTSIVMGDMKTVDMLDRMYAPRRR